MNIRLDFFSRKQIEGTQDAALSGFLGFQK